MKSIGMLLSEVEKNIKSNKQCEKKTVYLHY